MKSLTRILIIEDNPDDEALVLRELKKADMDEHVLVIRDGAKALRFLSAENFASEEFAAVFLDLKLPNVSGLKVLETIRRPGAHEGARGHCHDFVEFPGGTGSLPPTGRFLLRVQAAYVFLFREGFCGLVPGKTGSPRLTPRADDA